MVSGANEFRWRPGKETSLAPPMFEPEVFRKQMYCIEESTCNIVGTFRRPRSDSAPGELCPACPLRYAPVWPHHICITLRITISDP